MPTPTTLEELRTARAAAGTAYAAAIAALQSSFIELAAYDRALQNSNVIIGMPGYPPIGYPTFHDMADNVPQGLRHPEFGTYVHDWRAQVKALSDQVITNVTGR